MWSSTSGATLNDTVIPGQFQKSQLARQMSNARKEKFTPPQRQEPRTTHLSKNIPSGERYRMKHSCKRKHRGVTMPVFQELKEQTIIPIPLLSSIHQSIHQSIAYTRALWDRGCVRVRVHVSVRGRDAPQTNINGPALFKTCMSRGRAVLAPLLNHCCYRCCYDCSCSCDCSCCSYSYCFMYVHGRVHVQVCSWACYRSC